MSNRLFDHIPPGSIHRITPDQLRDAWASRKTDRAASLAVFREAVFSMRKYEMEQTLGVTSEELTEFLAPRIPAETSARIAGLLPAKGRPFDDDQAAALDRAIGELRYNGWFLSEIGEALDLPRQSVTALNPSGPVVPLELDGETVPVPERIRFFSRRMVPEYLFVDAAPVRASVRDVPEDVKKRLIALDDAVIEATKRTLVDRSKSQDELWELVRRAEAALVAYARGVSKESNVSLVSLSRVLRGSNRNYLARMARRHGIDEHVPDSVAKVSPVRKTWEKSRTSVADALDFKRD